MVTPNLVQTCMRALGRSHATLTAFGGVYEPLVHTHVRTHKGAYEDTHKDSYEDTNKDSYKRTHIRTHTRTHLRTHMRTHNHISRAS